jgi:hypothetical protein
MGLIGAGTELQTCDGFDYSLASTEKKAKVASFSLDRFFEKYPRSLHSAQPLYNSDNAPINNYAPDWAQISASAKAAAHWTCQNPRCGIDLSEPGKRQYLHVHHRDGQKKNNSPSNLVVLRLRCHAEEPAHSHLKMSSEYRLFTDMLWLMGESLR